MASTGHLDTSDDLTALLRAMSFITACRQLAKLNRTKVAFPAALQFRGQRYLSAQDEAAEDTKLTIGMGPGAATMSPAEWSRRKNSGAGPAVSARCKPGSLSGAAPTGLVAERLPGMPTFMPAFLLQGVLSHAECRSLIEAVPAGGPGYFSSDEIYQLYQDRVVSYRFLTDDEGLSSLFMSRIRSFLPEELDGGRILRINPAWRFVHQETGGHQAAHIDGREPVEPQEAAGGWVQSRLTLQVYLSDDFGAGELAFVVKDPKTEELHVRHLHKPKTGDALIFYQERLMPPTAFPPYEVLHEARNVTWGHKYACRTMVDYVFPNSQVAKMSNLKDDRAR